MADVHRKNKSHPSHSHEAGKEPDRVDPAKFKKTLKAAEGEGKKKRHFEKKEVEEEQQNRSHTEENTSNPEAFRSFLHSKEKEPDLLQGTSGDHALREGVERTGTQSSHLGLEKERYSGEIEHEHENPNIFTVSKKGRSNTHQAKTPHKENAKQAPVHTDHSHKQATVKEHRPAKNAPRDEKHAFTSFEKNVGEDKSVKAPEPKSHTKTLEQEKNEKEAVKQKEKTDKTGKAKTPLKTPVKSNKKKQKIDSTPTTHILAPPGTTPVTGTPQVAPSSPVQSTSAAATLPKEVFALLERMAGIVMIQKTSNVTTTKVTVNMPNSVFDGAQIVLKHHKAAGRAFDIQFFGSPKAVDVFNQHAAGLVAALKANEHEYEINLHKPALSEKYRTKKSAKKVNRKKKA